MDRRQFLKTLGIAALGAMMPTKALATQKDNDSTMNNRITFTSDIAIEMAERFAKGMMPDMDLTVDCPVTIGDGCGNVVGYSVTLFDNLTPHGYIVFDVDAPGVIAEYSFEEGSAGPISYLQKTSEQIKGRLSFESGEFAIRRRPFDYELLSNDGSRLLSKRGSGSLIETYTENSGSATKPATWADATVDIVDVYKNYTILAMNNLPSWVCTTQDTIVALTGRYACVVTALFVCAAYYGLVNPYTDGDAYIELWDLTKTTKDPNNGDTSALWGLTNFTDGLNGFIEFCARRGKNVTGWVSNGKPPMYDFTNSIDNGDICNMAAGLINPATNIREGHQMAVEAYIQAASDVSFGGLAALGVFDGWFSGIRYINYDFDRYTDFVGVFLVD